MSEYTISGNIATTGRLYQVTDANGAVVHESTGLAGATAWVDAQCGCVAPAPPPEPEPEPTPDPTPEPASPGESGVLFEGAAPEVTAEPEATDGDETT